MPMLWCLLAAVLFGASTPATKPLLDRVGPFLLAGLLYAGAALAVLPWALRGVRRVRTLSRRNAGYFVGAIFFGGVVGPVLLLFGLRMAPAGTVSLWLNLELVATAVLAVVFFREHVHLPTWLAVVLIVGASVLLTPGIERGGIAGLLVAGACVAWGLDNNFTAVIDEVTPTQTTFAKGLVAAVVNITIGVLVMNSGGEMRTTDIAIAGGIGALSYGASIVLYIAGAQQIGATRSQLLFSTAPFWGVTLAWVWLGERVLWQQVAAGALMIAGIYLMQRERHAHEHTHAPLTHTHRHRHDDGHHDHVHDPPVPPGSWHSHEHTHDSVTHTHEHEPDLHHRHEH